MIDVSYVVPMARPREKEFCLKLFHGSYMIVKEPRIITPERMLDFGAGFYATTDSEQQYLEFESAMELSDDE
jgi:hypothetical protein